MTQFHVTTTQCHVTKSRIAASADSKLFAGGHCDVAMTRFHMDMSRRHLSTHDCGCTPTQNPVEATSNHMPATQSESALEQTPTSSSRHHMVLVRYHMVLLQILLDRYFVLLRDEPRCGAQRLAQGASPGPAALGWSCLRSTAGRSIRLGFVRLSRPKLIQSVGI